MIPAVADDARWSTGPSSRSVTCKPRRQSEYAVANPIMPPPITRAVPSFSVEVPLGFIVDSSTANIALAA